MWLLYLFAIIPIIIGFVLWLKYDKVNLIEWISGSVAAFVLAGIIHACAIAGMTGDQEVWSGRITHATYYPEWVEEYEVAVYRTETHTETDSEGNTTTTSEEVFDHYETHYRTHDRYWEATTDLNYDKTISETFFKEISKNFNNLTTKQPYKSGFYSGDKNIYVAYNKTGFIYPVTDIRRFENRIKAAPTVFSFPKIPTGIKVYEYPLPHDWLVSTRLINENKIDIKEFDRLNTRLGFKKRVNLIMINFDKQDQSIAQYQEAKFIGGKKNDLVMCYGNVGANGVPGWSYVFGWTEKALCKRNLETILLTNPINNAILSYIEREVIANYTIKDWTKFSYISIEPRSSTYIWYFLFMFITQIGLYIFFFKNDIDKGDGVYTRYNSRDIDI
jgi:hypothetical protein